MFVDNLPESMTKSWLWQLFDYNGKVIDVFIPQKKRRTNRSMLAFVRYSQIQEAKAVIKNMDGMEIRGNTIWIKMAEYKRSDDGGRWMPKIQQNIQMRGNDQHGSSRIRSGMPYKDAVLQKENIGAQEINKGVKQKGINDEDGKGKYEATRVVYGEVNRNIIKELERSVIGEAMCPLNSEEVKKLIHSKIHSVEKVREIGLFKSLITFHNKQGMLQALEGEDNILGGIFDEVRPWTSEEVCQTRRVWIECFGIPLHAWSLENLKKIGEQWGTVVGFDNETEQQLTFSSAKILLDTCCFQFIKGFINVHVKEMYGEDKLKDPLFYSTKSISEDKYAEAMIEMIRGNEQLQDLS